MSSQHRGSALVEVTWIGLLLMLPLLWIVLSVFQVQRGAFATSAAVRAAARAYALAADDVAGERQARAVIDQALAGQGIDSSSVHFSCTPYPHDCHSGTSVITVRLDTAVDLPLLPDVLGGGAPRFALHATQTVPIGQFQEVTDGR
ncbi:hypothetical protein GCM10028801_36250 [Nocardioides maradonensis]